MDRKLGKLEYQHDPRTLLLASYLKTDEIAIPATFNFDAKRAAFPDHMWGNDQYGDCVIAARANAQLRIERIEQRRTLALVDDDAIKTYKQMTGCQQPEDENDTGLVMLDAMKQWKNTGFGPMTRTPHRTYTISAYGEVDQMNREHVRAAIFMLHGVHFGFSLPVAAQRMTDEGVWDYQGQSGSEWRAGSWGGHAVLGFAYDPDSVTIKTWGENVKVTNAFMEKFCDEAWAVVDDIDNWRAKSTVDVATLTADLRSISSKVNE